MRREIMEQIGRDRGNGFEAVLEEIDYHRMYRTGEVARLLCCSVRYVQVLVEMGELESLRVGRMIRIPGDGLAKFIAKYKEFEQ